MENNTLDYQINSSLFYKLKYFVRENFTAEKASSI